MRERIPLRADFPGIPRYDKSRSGKPPSARETSHELAISDFVPQGVIPAVLLPFHDDLSIDERSFRAHLRDVASVQGLSAITVNAHSTEVASCTSDEQRRVMEIAGEEVGSALPIIHGVWADGSLEAARIARRAEAGGASALLVFPPAPFTMGQTPEMALAHFKTIADATDLPMIVFQYPLATGQGYPLATLERLFDEVPTIRAIKDWTDDRAAARAPDPQRCKDASVRSTCSPPTAPG